MLMRFLLLLALLCSFPVTEAQDWSPWRALGPFDHVLGTRDLDPLVEGLGSMEAGEPGLDYGRRFVGKAGVELTWKPLAGVLHSARGLDLGQLAWAGVFADFKCLGGWMKARQPRILSCMGIFTSAPRAAAFSMLLLACASDAALHQEGSAAGAPSGPGEGDPLALHLSGVEPVELEGWKLVPSARGEFLLAWRPVGGGLRRNEYHELEVAFYQSGQLLEDVELEVLGWMPAHGHGFLRRTEVEARPAGGFLVKGVLFHMRGQWQLTFDVTRGDRVDKLVIDLDF